MILKGDKIIYSTARKEYFEYELLSKKTNTLTIETYCERIFGTYNYRLRTLLDYSFAIGKNQILGAHIQISNLLVFDLKGNLIEKKKGFFDDCTPYKIALSENEEEIWIATGSGQTVICRNIITKETTYILGTPYETENGLSFPEDVEIYKNQLYISEMGNHQILQVDLENYTQKVYRKFNEPTWAFFKNEFAEIVSLESGIYQINGESLIKLFL